MNARPTAAPVPRIKVWALASAFLAVTASVAPLSAQGAPSFYEPGISPDGSEIAFVSGGDIWTVPATGGAARLLVAHSAHESRPLYSPDGSHLAFNSNRAGGQDVFLMDLSSGQVTRLTHESGSEQLGGWSGDGAWVYFTSSAEDVSGAQDVFRVRTTGGTPMAVAADRYETEFFAAPSPQGGRVAIATRGRMAQGQWWRNGHAHIDESEIWVLDEATTSGGVPTYQPVSTGGKNIWPMWGADGTSVYFMSDRSGTENLWMANADGTGERQLTQFTDGRFLWPSISADGTTIAFERDFGIWTYDVASGSESRLNVNLLGSTEGPTPEVQNEDSGWGDIAVSPDGKKWAFTSGGDVWATTMEGDVPATRVTTTPAAEGSIRWAGDSEQIVYSSWRTGTPKLYAYSFTTGTERQVTSGAGRDGVGEFSPDGESLAYSRMVNEERELRVIDWESGDDRRIAIDLEGGMTWSPDGNWIAYLAETDEFSNVMIIPAAGGEPRQVSFVANSNASSLDWSAKGDYLVYRTSQRTESSRLVKVDLVPLPPTFDEDEFRKLFNEPEEPRGGGGSRFHRDRFRGNPPSRRLREHVLLRGGGTAEP